MTSVKQGNGRLVVIVASEGGPPVVHSILSQIAGDFPVSIALCQAFQSGAIDPFCNALNRTTQLEIRSVDSVTELSPGLVCAMPHGFHAIVEKADGENSTRLTPMPGREQDSDPLLRFVKSACWLYGERMKLVLVGGMGAACHAIVPCIEAVVEYGGEAILVSECDVATLSEPGTYDCKGVRIECLTVDQLVAKLYAWCGLADKIRRPI